MKKSGARKPQSNRTGTGSRTMAPDGTAIAADLAPPKHLSAEAAEWWRRTVQEYTFAPGDPGLLLLLSALEAFDRMREAQRQLARDGITTTDRFGQVRQHPATMIERDARTAMARLIRQLGLDLEPLRGAGRPPGR